MKKRAPISFGSLERGLALSILLFLALVPIDAHGAFYRVAVSADSWIEEANPLDNHGLDPEVSVKGTPGDMMIGLYRFDLSSIPPGTDIARATAKLYVTNPDASSSVLVMRIAGSWEEGTVNWANAISLIDNTTPYGILFPDRNGYVEFDLTDLVRGWVGGSFPNHGLMLVTLSSNESRYTSREWLTQSELPYMDVVTGTSTMRVSSGFYAGDGGASRSIGPTGFKPDMVIVKGDGAEAAVTRTETMPEGFSKELGVASALLPDAVTSLDQNGFTIGPDPHVNDPGTLYYWIAFESAPGEMVMGTYTGDGVDNRVISGLPFQPGYLIVMSSSAQSAMQRFASETGDASLPFEAGGENVDRIQAFYPGGFEIGKHNTVNEPGFTFHYVAWRLVPERISSGSYPGDGLDNRDITGVGLQPDVLLLARQGNGSGTAARSSAMVFDQSLLLQGGPILLDAIQDFIPDGFQVGQAPEVNTSGQNYFWVAFQDAATMDLSVSKAASAMVLNEGDTIRFDIKVANGSSQSASGIVLSDKLPPGITYLTNVPSQGSYNPSSGLWLVGSIPPGMAAGLALFGTMDVGTAGSSITNTAWTAASDQTDSDASNDTSSVTVRVKAVDLFLSKSAKSNSVDVGDTILFALNLSNSGPDTATAIAVLDSIDPGLTYLGATTSEGTYDEPAGIWSLDSLAPSASAALTLFYLAPVEAAGTAVENRALVIALREADLDPLNNVDSSKVEVLGVDLVLAKHADKTFISEGDTVEYTVVLDNRGPSDASGTTVGDTIPSGMSLLSVSAGGGSYDQATGIWSIPVLPAGSADTLSLVVYASGGTSGTAITNRASLVSVNESDIDPGNDSDSVIVRVNAPPYVAADIPDTTLLEDNQPVDNFVDLNAIFDDIESGSQLSFSIAENSDTSLINVSIDPDSALDISVRPDSFGAATVIVRGTDELGAFAEDTFTVTVASVNDPPVVVSNIPDTMVTASSVVAAYRDLASVFFDKEDTDSLLFQIVYNSNPLAVSAWIDTSNSLSFTAASDTSASALISVRATDSGSSWAEDTFIVTVSPKVFLDPVPGSLYPAQTFVKDPDLALRIGIDNRSSIGVNLATSSHILFSDGTNTYQASLANFTYVPAGASDFTLSFSPAPVPPGMAAPAYYDLFLVMKGSDDNGFSLSDTLTTAGKDSLFLETPKVRLTALPLDVQSALPGSKDRELLSVDFENGYDSARILDTLIVYDTGSAQGTLAELEAAIELLNLYDDVDSSLGLSPADTVVASSLFSGGKATFAPSLGWSIPPSSHRCLIVAADLDSFKAADGDVIDAAVVSPADVVFGGSTIVADEFSPLYPIDSFGRLVIDGMARHQVPLVRSSLDTLDSGSSGNLLLTIHFPMNGYMSDTLNALAIKNYAPDFLPSDLDRILLYRDEGDGIFDLQSDLLLGELVYSGDRFQITGLDELIDSANTFFIAADIALDPADGDHFLPGITQAGIEMSSGNDGPLDGSVVPAKSFFIDRIEKLDVRVLPVTQSTPHPGDVDVPLLLFEVENLTLSDVVLDTLRIENGARGRGTPAQLDAELAYLRIALDDGDGKMGQGDAVLADSLRFNAGSIVATALDQNITSSETIRILVVCGIDSSCTADGDTLAVAIADRGGLGFTAPVKIDGAFPMETGAALVTDGMMAHQMVVFPATDSLVITSYNDVLLFDCAIPGNGYADDTLRALEIEQLGTASTEHLARLALYADGGNGLFDKGADDDIYLGDFLADATKTWGTFYRIDGLNVSLIPGCTGVTRFFVAADLNRDFSTGATVRFAVPRHSVEVSSNNDGPIDAAVQDPSMRIIPQPDQITVFPYSSRDQVVYPGSKHNLNFGIGFYNGYSSPLLLTRLDLFQSGTASGAEIDSVFAYADIDTNGLFDPNADSLLAVLESSGPSYKLAGLDLQLAPKKISYVFASYHLPLAIRDGVTVDFLIVDKQNIHILPSTPRIEGEFPMNSPGTDRCDGMVASQVELYPVPQNRVAPGDTNVLALSFVVPANGIWSDVLEGVSIENYGSAVQGSDIATLKLWKESGGDLHRFDEGQEVLLSQMQWNGSAWSTIPSLGEPVPLAGAHLYVTFDVGTAPADGATFQAALPLGAIEVQSQNDGPIDRPLTNPAQQIISTDPLLTSLSTDRDTYTIGQDLTLSMRVRNRGQTPLTGIVPSDPALSGSGGVVLSWGPVPVAIDLAPSEDSTFAWSYSTVASGELTISGYAHTSDSTTFSRNSSTGTVTIQDRADSAEVDLSDLSPPAADLSQENVSLLRSVFLYRSQKSYPAPIELASMTLAFEDGQGTPIAPGSILSALTFQGDGGFNEPIILSDTTSNPLDVDFQGPPTIEAEDSFKLNILADIAADAPTTSFRVLLQSDASFEIIDGNDSGRIPIHSDDSFPWATGLVNINLPADTILVSEGNNGDININEGQEGVNVFEIVFEHPGPVNEASIMLTDVTLSFFDTSLSPIPPEDVVRSIRIESDGQLLYQVDVLNSGGNSLACALTNPLILSPGSSKRTNLLVDTKTLPTVPGFVVGIESPLSVTARDMNNNQQIVVASDSLPLVDFPFRSGSVLFQTAASGVSASNEDLLPPIILPGQDSIPAMKLFLAHMDSSRAASIVLDSLALDFSGAGSLPLFPGDYLSRLWIERGDSIVFETTSLSNAVSTVECKLSPFVTIAPASSETLEVFVDAKSIFTPNELNILLARNGLVVQDANDGKRIYDFDGMFPLTAGPSSLQLPATEAGLSLLSLLPPNVAAGDRRINGFDLVAENANPAGYSPIEIRAVSVSLREPKGSSIVPASLVSTAYLLFDTTEVQASFISDRMKLDIPPGEVRIQPGQSDTLRFLFDLAPSSSEADFLFSIDDSTRVTATETASGDTISVTPLNGNRYPLRTTSTHLLSPDIHSAFTNYPNPFAAGREKTWVTYYLDERSIVSLRVYTIWGAPVITLIDGETLQPGLHQETSWDGRNGEGDVVNNGVYYMVMEIEPLGGSKATMKRKVAVVR